MFTVQTGFIEHDMANEVSTILSLSDGSIGICGMEFPDLDDIYQGAFLSSNDDVLVTFEFTEEYLKNAYHILGWCQDCSSNTIWSQDQAVIDSCPVTEEVMLTWVKEGLPWSTFKASPGFQKLMAMSEDELAEFSDENHYSSL